MSQSNKVIETMTVKNETGIHARPAAQLVKIINNFDCETYIRKGDEIADGKSIMELMMLAVGCGHNIEVTTEGNEANLAMEAIKSLISSGFKES